MSEDRKVKPISPKCPVCLYWPPLKVYRNLNALILLPIEKYYSLICLAVIHLVS